MLLCVILWCVAYVIEPGIVKGKWKCNEGHIYLIIINLFSHQRLVYTKHVILNVEMLVPSVIRIIKVWRIYRTSNVLYVNTQSVYWHTSIDFVQRPFLNDARVLSLTTSRLAMLLSKLVSLIYVSTFYISAYSLLF